MQNFITANHLVSLFPLNTFVHNRDLPSPPTVMSREEKRSRAFLDVPARNYNVEQDAGYAEDEIGERYVGDSRCWTLPCILPIGAHFLFTCEFVLTLPVAPSKEFRSLTNGLKFTVHRF